MPAGCTDTANNENCINVQDCGDPANGTCSVCLDDGNNCGELPVEPSGCVDVDGDGIINEIDCGAPENSSCTAPICSGVGGGDTGGGAGGGGAPSEGSWTGIDLTIQDVFAIITGLVCWFGCIAVSLMVIFIILAGLRFMNARGDPAALTIAKKNFSHVLLGLLGIMGVSVIIATVANAVGVTDFSFIPLVC